MVSRHEAEAGKGLNRSPSVWRSAAGGDGAGERNRTVGSCMGSKGIAIIRRPLWAQVCILSAAAALFNARSTRDIVPHGTGAVARPASR